MKLRMEVEFVPGPGGDEWEDVPPAIRDGIAQADGIQIIQHMETDRATGLVGDITVSIRLPADFPEKYREAVVRAANQCTVKKHFEHPPTIRVESVLTT